MRKLIINEMLTLDGVMESPEKWSAPYQNDEIADVSQKMGIKEGMRAFFVNAPKSALEAIHLPSLTIDSELQGEFDYLHCEDSPPSAF